MRERDAMRDLCCECDRKAVRTGGQGEPFCIHHWRESGMYDPDQGLEVTMRDLEARDRAAERNRANLRELEAALGRFRSVVPSRGGRHVDPVSWSESDREREAHERAHGPEVPERFHYPTPPERRWS